MRILLPLAILLSSIGACASEPTFNQIVNSIYASGILHRDSGQDVSEEFIANCTRGAGPKLFVLECDDIIFKHNIGVYESKGNDDEYVMLIIIDGASVENRIVFKVAGETLLDITSTAWPKINDIEISQDLVDASKNSKYSKTYIEQAAHSSYRTKLFPGNRIELSSGIPDETFGTFVKTLSWNGLKFE